jgi:hypothetical protein
MNKSGKLIAAAATLAMIVGTSAFADSRRQDGTWRDGSDRRSESNRSYRDNDRVTMQGRISDVTRERDGYRVRLDRGAYSYFVPSARLGGRDLRVGINISLGGVLRGDVIYVDDVGGYGDDYGYRDGGYRNEVVRGVVEHIDLRRDLLVLRDESSGRRVTVNMNYAGRRGRGVDLDDLRRGDFVTLSGDWRRGDLFQAYRIDTVRSRR